MVALSALACASQARYGACAAAYSAALGPSQLPACTASSSAASSSAVSAYSTLSELQVAADASSGPGPGPLLSSVECTSGGEAIQIGAVIAARRADRCDGSGRGGTAPL